MVGREYAAKRLKDSARGFSPGLDVSKKSVPMVVPECILQTVVVGDRFTKALYDFWRPREEHGGAAQEELSKRT